MAGAAAGAGIAGSMMRGGANIVSRHATTGRWTGGGTMIGGTVATGAVGTTCSVKVTVGRAAGFSSMTRTLTLEISEPRDYKDIFARSRQR